MIGGFVLAAAMAAQLPSPAQHQRSAMALYQIYIAAVAEGEFRGSRKDPQVSATKLDFELSLGSAVAISSDGYVVTANHVAGYTEIVSNVCDVMAHDWASVVIRRLELHVTLTDVADTVWPAIWEVRPPEGVGDICSGTFGMEFRVGAVRFVASAEPVADLALLKLELQDGATVMAMPLGTVNGLEPFRAPVSAFGYVDVGRRTRRDGYWVRACEQTPTEKVLLSSGVVTKRYLMMRFSAHLDEGMSGGPVVSNGKLIGVTVSKGLFGHVGLGVPADYIGRWLAFVRGGREGRFPDTVCEVEP